MITEEQLDAIIGKHRGKRSIDMECPSGEGSKTELAYLFPRLHRAFLGLEQMTPGRTAIFAETAAKLLARACFEIENGRKETATHLTTEVANSLLALKELEWAMLHSEGEN